MSMISKGVFRTITAIFISLVTSGIAFGADASLGLAINSAYVWRGITLNDGFVAQPSLDVKKGGADINVWGNMDLNEYNDITKERQFSEIDLTASYGFDLEYIDLSVGYIEYLFPGNAVEPAREIYASVSAEPLKGFSLGLNTYYEVGSICDYYASISISYGFNLTDKLSATLGVTAGYIGDDYAEFLTGGEGGAMDGNLSANLSYSIKDNIVLTAIVGYVDTLDKDVLPDQDVDSYGGINISCSL